MKKTLESLFRQDFSDREILVINDGSTDRTREFLDSLQVEGKIRCFHQANQGPALGRNLGLANAQGEIIAFIDDDCLAPPDWLTKYATRLQEWGCDGIGGAAETGNPENVYALTNDHVMNFFKSKNSGDKKVPFLTSNNAVYRKSVLERVGGFDPGFKIGAEERDLNLRLVESGAVLKYDPEITIIHFNDETFGKFVRHQVATGKGSHRLYAGAASRGTKLPIGAGATEYVGLISSPFRAYDVIRAVSVLLLIVLAQVAVTAGYFGAVLKGTNKG